MGIILLLFLVIAHEHLLSKTSKPTKVITTHERSDGFGAHVLHHIATFSYAEMSHKEFCYRPFNKMEHNYDNDPDFIQKKEWLLNFKDNFLNIDEAQERNYLIIEDTSDDHLSFFDRNVARCTKSLEKLKKIFRANKPSSYFNNTHFNVAVHIRRKNPHDNRIYGTDILDDLYVGIINKLRIKYSSRSPLFHIYSQGSADNFKMYDAPDVVLHLNESVEDTYLGMVFADVLVTGRSSLSYTAGYLSDGIVYYNSYLHAALPHWIPVRRILTRREKVVTYNLISGLPSIHITDDSEKIGTTWQNNMVYDKPLIEKFYSLLPKNKFFVAIDLGAQTGAFSLLAKYFPDSQWYSFEPIKEAADNLKENLALNDIHNVSVYQKAVSDFSGKAILKMPFMNQWGLATLGSNVLRFDLISEREVECVDLDSFIADNNVQKVDFIKIDTEGSEFQILRGAEKTIRRDQPIILMEYNETNMKQCNVNKQDLDNFLRAMNYEWALVSHEDILCVPKKTIDFFSTSF